MVDIGYGLYPMTFNPGTRLFLWNMQKEWKTSKVYTLKEVQMPALSSVIIETIVSPHSGQISMESEALFNVQYKACNQICSELSLVQVQPSSQMWCEIRSSAPFDISILSGQKIGLIKSVDTEYPKFPLDQENIEQMNTLAERNIPPEAPRPEQWKATIQQLAKINPPGEYCQQYLQLLQKHHSVFSLSKQELGGPTWFNTRLS